ncbi:hypothetical protein amrb99_01120 [Actinomadura sp. RB99]|nr:hypothetical protein [Actinomadura sp. RB99]
MIAVWASAMCVVAVLAASVTAFAMEQRRPRYRGRHRAMF